MPREVIQMLSPRESAILELAAEGLTDIAIAHRLGISDGTVGTYWGRIRTKLGPFPRAELVAIKTRADFKAEIESLEQERERLVNRLHEVEAAELLYEQIVDHTQEGVLILRADTSFVHVNPAALQIFGYSAEELATKRLPDLIPSRLRAEHFVNHLEYLKEPETRLMNPHLTTYALHRSGREIRVAVTLSRMHNDGEECTVCFVRPSS